MTTSPDKSELPMIGVVVPVKNEAENVGPLIEEIATTLRGKELFEIIYVDDGSDDATPENLRGLKPQYPELRVLRHRVSCGQSAAIATGIKAAVAPVIATLDGDGQNDPADIPALLERFRSFEDPDKIMIAGHRAKRIDSQIKLFSSKFANGIRSWMLGDDTPDTGCGLKIFSRAAFLDMPRFDHMHRFLPALMIRRGGQTESIRVNHRARERGISKYGVWNRLWVGIVDIMGLIWLQKRGSMPIVEAEQDE